MCTLIKSDLLSLIEQEQLLIATAQRGKPSVGSLKFLDIINDENYRITAVLVNGELSRFYVHQRNLYSNDGASLYHHLVCYSVDELIAYVNSVYV